MTTGAITPRLFSLAWPLVLGNLLQTFYNLADMFWVGRVSGEAVAAVSLMFPLSWMFVSTAMGITAATIALVSQYIGAGNRREADRVVGQTALLTTAVATVLQGSGWRFVSRCCRPSARRAKCTSRRSGISRSSFCRCR
ncbi:MatE protein [Halohasta litchfieldiae]|uniref:MatE protein n=1 Tax=Halohasta litchfieldiae TaxID=1073996 RepID=A0A1H6SEE4_9EURY|nr:MatE protein [Halohasta litchfieldiae]